MKKIFFLLFLICISFASLEWKSEVDAEISTIPLIFNGSIIVGTYDGSIYAFDPEDGDVIWVNKNLGTEVVKVVEFQGKIIVPLRDGKIFILRDGGVTESELNANGQIYGVESANNLYFTTENGLYTYQTGELVELYAKQGVYTHPTEYNEKIIFGVNENLMMVDKNGNVQWETELASLWTVKPIISLNTIYIGSMDHNLYSLNANDGNIKWSTRTNGAITASAYADGGYIYVGSNDGYLYSVNSETGIIKWKTEIGSGIFTTPIKTKIGNENVIVVGSNDGKITALRKNDGEIIWGYSTTDRVGDPIAYENRIIAGSNDKNVYALSTDRACIIWEPLDGEKIGYKIVKIKGMIFSTYESAEAELKINSGIWEKIKLGENNTFVYELDPNLYPFGLLSIECREKDSEGTESNPIKINLLRDAALPKPEFLFEYSSNVNEGEQILIYVKDMETGELVEDFKWEYKGKSYAGNEKIELNGQNKGKVEIIIKKTGYEDTKITILVNEVLDPIIMYVVGGIILILILGFIYLYKYR